MLIAKRLEKSQEIILCLIAFSIPFPFTFSTILVICLTFLCLVQLDFKLIFHNLKERKVLWVWIGYFLIFAISYFYSTNKKQSLFDLQEKLSFLILPLIIGAGRSVSKKILENILLFFSLGVTAIALFCICRSSYIWYNSHYTLIFFYNNLVKGLDASAVYEALYSIFSITILLIFPWENRLYKKRLFKTIMIFIQLVFFILLSSRTLLFLFFLLLLPLYIKKTIHKQNAFIKNSILISTTILIVVLFTTPNPIKQRYIDIIHTDPGKIELKRDGVVYDFNNLTLRLFLWKTCLQNMNEHKLWLTGAGNGDAQDLQNQKFTEYSVTDKKTINPLVDLNVHNMYLQSLLMIGIPGFIFYVILIFTPFFYFRHGELRYIILFFNFIICVFMIQESSFQTQAGIIFYTFFSMIFWNYYYAHRNITNVKKIG